MHTESQWNRLVPTAQTQSETGKVQSNAAVLGLALVAVGGISWFLYYTRRIEFSHWRGLWRSSSEDWKELSG